MIRLLTGVVLSLALGVAACGGDSAEQKAQKTVCSARADIKQQVDELKSTTIATASLDGVKAHLKSIGDSLSQMTQAQKDLKGSRKQQVQSANATFKSEVTGVAQEIGRSVTLTNGAQQMQAALQGLASGYEKALAPIDCSSS
jgi:conjugal transfer/entry exclusion protein